MLCRRHATRTSPSIRPTFSIKSSSSSLNCAPPFVYTVRHHYVPQKEKAPREGAGRGAVGAGFLLHIEGEIVGDEGRLERAVLRADEGNLNRLPDVRAQVE